MTTDNTTEGNERKFEPVLISLDEVGEVLPPIEVTFSKIAPGSKFTFVLRMQLSEEMEMERQRHLDLSDDERDEKKFEHNLALLADLLNEEPLGFKDFPTGGTLKARALAYFNKPDKPFAVLLVNTVIGAYRMVLTPDEYLREV